MPSAKLDDQHIFLINKTLQFILTKETCISLKLSDKKNRHHKNHHQVPETYSRTKSKPSMPPATMGDTFLSSTFPVLTS